MNWLRWSAIIFGVLILVSIGLFILFSPGNPDSAKPDAIIERVKESEGTIDNIKYRQVSMVGDRILIQAEYNSDIGDIPQQASDWHRLAESIANQLYADVVRSRGVEVQVYQENTLRAVAVAGL